MRRRNEAQICVPDGIGVSYVHVGVAEHDIRIKDRTFWQLQKAAHERGVEWRMR